MLSMLGSSGSFLLCQRSWRVELRPLLRGLRVGGEPAETAAAGLSPWLLPQHGTARLFSG